MARIVAVMMRALILTVSAMMIGCFTDSTTQPIPEAPDHATERTHSLPPQTQADSDNAAPGDRDMREELIKFIQSPDRTTYLAFREKIIFSDAYQPYSDEIATAGELYEQGRLVEARDTVHNAMGNLVLSLCAINYWAFSITNWETNRPRKWK